MIAHLALFPRGNLREQHVKVFLGAREVAALLRRVDVVLLDALLALSLDGLETTILGSANFDARLEPIAAEVPLNQ